MQEDVSLLLILLAWIGIEPCQFNDIKLSILNTRVSNSRNVTYTKYISDTGETLEVSATRGCPQGRCHPLQCSLVVEITDSPVCERCHNGTEIASHIRRECDALVILKIRWLGKHVMERSDYDEIPLCKILYFVGGTGLLAECRRWGRVKDQKMVAC
jgi:hypothetical protein